MVLMDQFPCGFGRQLQVNLFEVIISKHMEAAMA